MMFPFILYYSLASSNHAFLKGAPHENYEISQVKLLDIREILCAQSIPFDLHCSEVFVITILSAIAICLLGT